MIDKIFSGVYNNIINKYYRADFTHFGVLKHGKGRNAHEWVTVSAGVRAGYKSDTWEQTAGLCHHRSTA